MAIATGLGKSIGYGEQTNEGVAVAPTFWLPVIDTGMDRKIDRIQSKAVIAGARVGRSSQWAPGNITAGGKPTHELLNKSIGKLLKWSIGSVSTSGPDGNSMYAHTFTPGDLALFSTQTGIPDVGATTRPSTWFDCTPSEWEIGFAVAEDCTWGWNLVAANEILFRQVTDAVTVSSSPTVTTATGAIGPDDLGKPVSDGGVKIPANSYIGKINSATSFDLSSVPLGNTAFPTPVNASSAGTGITLTIGLPLTNPSYASGIKPITFLGASVTVAGSAVNVISGTIGGKNGLATRRFIGNPQQRKPLENAIRQYSGKLVMEFESNLQYLHFCNGDEFALVVTLADGVLATSQKVVFTANVRYDGATPTAKGTEVAQIEIPYMCIGPSSDAGALTAVYTTTESTP